MKNNLRVYTKGSFLMLEDYLLVKKINYKAIENIIIYHVGETYNNQIDFYLNEPIIYERINEKWWNKLVYNFFFLNS